MPSSITERKSRIARRVRPRDLHILASVVEAGSIAKAAERLGISQSSVSETIANLECMSGVRLLRHGPDRVAPTAEATALLGSVPVVHDEVTQGAQESAVQAGGLRIGCSETLASGFVPAVIERMSRDHPSVMFHVVPVEPARFGQLRDHSVDLIIGRILNPPLDRDLAAQILFRDRFRVVAGPYSPWHRRRKIRFEELMNEPWIHNPFDTPLHDYVADGLRRQGLDFPKPTVVSQSLHVRHHLLATGGLLTLLWESTLDFTATGPAIMPLEVDLRIPPRPVAAVTLKHRTPSPVAKHFIQHAWELAQAMRPTRRQRSRHSPG